jgi:hypothetical protein
MKSNNLNIKQAPIYGDTKVLAPNGEVMFLCLPKKANWYLDRNLATIVSYQPMVIKLTFEPKGRGQNGDPYYLGDKPNKCVVCGVEEDLTRHHIVPYTYRKHFPENIKSHNSHDIVPICIDHHTEYEEDYAIELKCIFAERYDAKLEDETKKNSDLTIVVKYSNMLLDNKCKLPYHRKKQMISTIRNYHGYIGSLKRVLLTYAYNDLTKSQTESHGKIVVEKLIKDDLLQWFVETWREHFIYSMNPIFMPKHWNVNRQIDETIQ